MSFHERFEKIEDWAISSQRKIMLTDDIIKKIESGEIKSRRQLYKHAGRSKKLLQWLNENNILVPVVWDKSKVKVELLKIYKNKKRIPNASDNFSVTKFAQKYYGSWNSALKEVFGEINQNRYSHLSDEYLLNLIRNYILKYQSLPLRTEFDGSSDKFPYWEVYINRFNIKKWSQVFSLIDLSGLKFYSKHGYGKIKYFNGNLFLSNEEYLIAKYLDGKNIKFEKEVDYENSNYIFDFFLPEYNVYIEYYGMTTKDYMSRVEEKRKFYNNRKVIEIFKHDNTVSKLDFEVQRL